MEAVNPEHSGKLRRKYSTERSVAGENKIYREARRSFCAARCLTTVNSGNRLFAPPHGGSYEEHIRFFCQVAPWNLTSGNLNCPCAVAGARRAAGPACGDQAGRQPCC